RDKIGDVVAHRSLTPEAKASEAMSLQVPPQKRLGASHRAPQLFGAYSLRARDLVVWHTPLPTPPPQGGRERDSFSDLTESHIITHDELTITRGELTAFPSRRRESHRLSSCLRARRAGRRGSGRARNAPRFRRRCRDACPALSCGRISTPGWFQRND